MMMTTKERHKAFLEEIHSDRMSGFEKRIRMRNVPTEEDVYEEPDLALKSTLVRPRVRPVDTSE